jgi:hypothetical protein
MEFIPTIIEERILMAIRRKELDNLSGAINH